ncbi:type II/IV secretion system ATPase subunit [Halocatena marina]|uniref:Type II/IV secretion system ATPase subunit n=1 Tax=Halocatena marina TaxID=2934937 RepID=A0ABD5YGJ5_9EURY|nr:type II/IV secretion system ATPase subunit [Halocatena marina]
MQTSAGMPNETMTVPPPVAPADSAAWYAPDVCSQYEIHSGVVATIRQTRSATTTEKNREFAYEVREPRLSEHSTTVLERIVEYFSAADLERPLTRRGAIERMQQGFDQKYEQKIDQLIDLSSAARRRVEYHALARIRCFEELTPYALDDRIEGVDWTDENVTVYTREYSATASIEETVHRNRFTNERLRRYTVSFLDFEIPVVIYRERALDVDPLSNKTSFESSANDPFTTKYAVLEPDLLPGDTELIEECKERLWEIDVDEILVSRAADRSPGSSGTNRITFVRERAETLLARQLTSQNTRAWLDSVRYRFHAALVEYNLLEPPISDRYSPDRLTDLLYYVLRDYIGHGQLTVPIRDGRLEDIEANRVGDRIKVVPRGMERIPTNHVFEDEEAFINVVTQLAAADGIELNASTPSAKVNLDPVDIAGESTGETIRCAVALPIISEDGPHISIRKQSPDPLTPVDLVQNGSIPTEFVALLWLLFEYHGVVLFSGPTGVGKTTLMNAHIPFIPHDARPISIDEGSREVRLPHETGVSLRTRDHQETRKQMTMADLMVEANYLNPDVEVIAEINTPESFATFGEIMSTGHGIIGTTHAETMERLVNRVIEQGLPSYLLSEIDLVIFPRYVDGKRYVGEVVEIVSEPDGVDTTTIRREDTTIHYNTILKRTPDGDFTFAYDESASDDSETASIRLFERLAERTDYQTEDIESSFDRKHRYVEHLIEEDVTDIDDLFGFLTSFRKTNSTTIGRERQNQLFAPHWDWREDTTHSRNSENDIAINSEGNSFYQSSVELESIGEKEEWDDE